VAYNSVCVRSNIVWNRWKSALKPRSAPGAGEEGGGRGGGTTLYGLYRHVLQDRVWFMEVLAP